MFSKQLKYLKIIAILVISFFLITNFYMIISTKDKILTNKEQNTLKNIDFILVLGAGIKNKTNFTISSKDPYDSFLAVHIKNNP